MVQIKDLAARNLGKIKFIKKIFFNTDAKTQQAKLQCQPDKSGQDAETALKETPADGGSPS